ncbi:MAG: SDR family oxidoreductase, partial [Anaerolineales bacterium]
LTAAFRCTRAALRPMIRQRAGRIINVTSVAGQMGNAGQANYAAAKAGMIGLTRATAREVASRGITINAVAPGMIEVGMTERLTPDQVQRFVEAVPLGRLGTAEEVAQAVVYLASDGAGYVTGQVLNVDGGLVMR